MARGWDRERTLVHAPRPREGYELGLRVIGRMFARDRESPLIWMFSTIGLCKLEQPTQPERTSFRRFELVLVTNNAERDDPFPTRLGVALSQGSDFVAWDWNQVDLPPLMDWLVIAGEEIGALIKSGSHFAATDTLTLGPGKSSWTRSVLDHSVLLAAPPHLLACGFAPFDRPGDPSETVNPADWHRDPGSERFEYGFYWLLPVTEREHARAKQDGTWSVFSELLERARAESRDDCAVAFDLLRT
jgi:hypothetical protein